VVIVLKTTVNGRFVRELRLEDERYIDIEDPAALIASIKAGGKSADIFSFCQRVPESKPKFDYYMEFDQIAALPITSLERWMSEQIPKQTRTSIRKAVKKGVVVREEKFDDQFIRGMTKIFNETPIRQGRPFWHYGKDFETVKKEFSKYSFREDHIGAYFNDELIGFIFLAYAGRYAITIQIISMVAHQDKKPNNLLLAKAVEICANKGIPYLVYGRWARGTWGEFKENNGFENVLIPRYYVPLTLKGYLALLLRLHHGIRGILPERLILKLIKLRKSYYNFKNRNLNG